MERTCGLSNGYIGKQDHGKGSIGSNVLAKIEKHYPDLNLIWLITGKGHMLSTQVFELADNNERGISRLSFIKRCTNRFTQATDNPTSKTIRRKRYDHCFITVSQIDQASSVYAETGSQVQIKFLSPCVLLTLPTLGQNLFCVT
jgi:hypothetical protein